MTIKNFLKNSNKIYNIEYYFEFYCTNCKKYVTELDEEYSLLNSDTLDEYEWIKELEINKEAIIKDNTIKITTQTENNLCKKCLYGG